jgi:hypothetical protein
MPFIYHHSDTKCTKVNGNVWRDCQYTRYHHSDIIKATKQNNTTTKEDKKMMKLDIQINGNVIDGRQGWAYICNSMRVPVLKADLDREQKESGFATFDEVRVIWEYRGHESGKTCTLECENGKWSLGSWGCCLKGDFTIEDRFESIKEASLPIVKKDQVVAIALHSKLNGFVILQLFKVGKIDINCMTVADLKPLTDEEMQEVKKDIERWCDR